MYFKIVLVILDCLTFLLIFNSTSDSSFFTIEFSSMNVYDKIRAVSSIWVYLSILVFASFYYFKVESINKRNEFEIYSLHIFFSFQTFCQLFSMCKWNTRNHFLWLQCFQTWYYIPWYKRISILLCVNYLWHRNFFIKFIYNI